MNIALIGLRGTGKSTCGRILAHRLGWQFLDTDEMVQERAGKSIWEVFEEGGEASFRKLESEVVAEVTGQTRAVIAMGGGAVLDPINLNALKRTAFVVHLGGSPRELWRRIEADRSSRRMTRPRVRNTELSGVRELEELLLKRSAAYSLARDVEVRVERRTPEQIVDAILLLMRTRSLLPNELQDHQDPIA